MGGVTTAYCGIENPASGATQQSVASTYTSLAAGQNLNMSAANFGTYNNKKFAVSAWINTGAGTSPGFQIGKNTANGTSDFRVDTQPSNNFNIAIWDTGGTRYDWTTNAGSLYTNLTYFHIYYIVDTAQATATDRLQLWVNGTRITVWGAQQDTVPINTQVRNSTDPMYANAYVGGFMYQFAFFSATVPSAATMYNSGHPLTPAALIGQTGLYSTISTDPGDAITKDLVLATAWTNTGTCTRSNTIPP